MDAKEREQHKLKLIKTIITSPSYDMKELLATYALYLSNTPDTLYNISYYTDRIDDFIKRINDLPLKVKWFDSIFDKIKFVIDSHPLKDEFIFIFDELFAYTTSTLDLVSLILLMSISISLCFSSGYLKKKSISDFSFLIRSENLFGVTKSNLNTSTFSFLISKKPY